MKIQSFFGMIGDFDFDWEGTKYSLWKDGNSISVLCKLRSKVLSSMTVVSGSTTSSTETSI